VIWRGFTPIVGAAVAAALTVMAPGGAGATTVYNSLSDWTAAVGGNIESVDLSGPVATEDSGGNVIVGASGVSTITTPTGVLLTLDQSGFHRDLTGGDVWTGLWNGQVIFIVDSFTQDTLTLTLSANLPAFGLEMATGNEPFDMSVILSDGTVISSNGPVDFDTPQFFGWTGAADLTSITLQCGDPANDGDACANEDANGFQNGFAFADLVVPVPEPGSLLIFGAGLIGLGAWRRRRAAAA